MELGVKFHNFFLNQGSPGCYEYCELAEQLAALMALLASYQGRHRHRRSQTNDMEELILNNLYVAFIDLEECIQFSECHAEKIKVVHAALSSITESSKSLGTLSRDFMASIHDFNEARIGQVDRALSNMMPFNCSLFEKTVVLGEAATVASCLALKAAAAPATQNHPANVECNREFGGAVSNLLDCSTKNSKCSNRAVFDTLIVLLDHEECVSQAGASQAVNNIGDKISNLMDNI